MAISKVTLRFPDEPSLQEFVKIIGHISKQVSFKELLLTCECQEAEIELAEKGFHAQVVNKEMPLH